MLFKPELMSEFQSEIIPIATAGIDGKPRGNFSERSVFSLKLSPAERFALQQRLVKGDARFARNFGGESFSNWAGMPNQTPNNACARGIIDTAVSAFDVAQGEMQTSLSRAAPVFSPVGSSFSVGRVMVGHPKAAITRPRAKLPPKQISLSLNAWCGLSAEDIARSVSRIARAAWNYKLAGGQVEITISYLHIFTIPQEWNGVKHYGFLDTLKINPVNAGAFASAVSAQMYRAISMPVASHLSGRIDDRLPLCAWGKPGVHPITGNASADARMLETLRIA